MRSNLFAAALSLAVLSPLTAVSPASAQDYRGEGYHDGGYDRGYGDRGYGDRSYHGHDGRYYRHRCGGGNGAVGTIAGGVGGAVIGSALGGGTLGTIAGGVGGGLLGRHLDKKHTEHERGC